MMPKITVTFQEEGSNPIGFEIPEEFVEKIDLLVGEQNTSSDPNVPAYAGKSDWFMAMCYQRILKPIMERFPQEPPALALELRSRAAQLLRQADQVEATARITPIKQVTP